MKNKRTKKYPSPRTLQAKWTIELEKDLQPQHSVDLVGELARILSEEIDREIVQELRDIQEKNELMQKGWVKAPFTIEKFARDPLNKIEDVSAWIHMNATGEYRIFGREFWFQRQRDLTAFILRWS